MEMLPVGDAAKGLEGKGFERIEQIHGSTYIDNSTIIVIPTRGMIHHKVISAWQNLIPLMNQKRAVLFAAGHEVGTAYNTMIQNILNDPNLSKWKYILTLEDDNIPPSDAHVRLIESMHKFNFDAVSGIYFTKGEINMPMAYGDPEEYKRTGVLDFKPLNVSEALKRGEVVEVNGIAMGCGLWKLELFKQIPPPWFVTVNDIVPDKGVQCFTQDLYFCNRAKAAGKRFAVDFRVRVGHLDVNTGEVY